MQLKVLFVEDDEKLGENLVRSFTDMEIAGHQIKPELQTSFDKAVSTISHYDYDIVILDLYQDQGTKDEEAGIKILEKIRQTAFVPVIFYTGHAYKITDLSSEIVGVVNKAEGIDGLVKEMERIISSKLALIKGRIYNHLREFLRQYFWETVDTHKEIFKPGQSDVSLGYLLLRRFANSLSKENIKDLLWDDKIDSHKVHPMEFYIFPVTSKEYEAGEIVKNDDGIYVLLTPSCDFVSRTKKDGSSERKVGSVLLAKVIELDAFSQLQAYKDNQNKENRNRLIAIISNNLSDRFFFLPKTPFINNSVIDFQKKIMVEYEQLSTFQRVAKLDAPISESMISSFIRYYNRIGFPDIDADYVLNNL
jgi:DNA-binding response OmpR family regulator